MHGEGQRNPEHTNRAALEEKFAADKRVEYVNDFYQATTEQLLEESQQVSQENKLERRKNEKLKNELSEMKAKAEHDPLTGLLNRAGFDSVINSYREQHKDQKVDGTLLVLDIDKFKSINDEFGHAEGDRALKEVANYLLADSRDGDFVARLGGEELAVFYPGTSVDNVVSKFQNKETGKVQIEVPFDFVGGTRQDNLITFSGGITELSANEPLESAIDRADKALYEAKGNDRNHLLVAGRVEEIAEQDS